MRHTLAGLCLLILALLVACQHVKTPPVAFSDEGEYLGYRGGEGLVADPDSPIPDVPKPIGFKPLPSKSASSYDGYARRVTHVYQGRGRIADVGRYFRQHLPLEGWTFESSTPNAEGSLTQRWTKGPEALQVHAAPGKLFDTVDSSVTTITIHIGPNAG